MKKFAITFIALAQFASALSVEQLQQDLDAGKYEQLCTEKVFNYAKAKRDETALSIYGDACARTDWLNRLSGPITLLRATPEGRTNAVVFATLLYKKKLLQAALIDGLDIKMIALPHIDNVLSEIYDDYIAGAYTQDKDVFVFNKDNQTRRLWVDRSSTPAKLILEIDADGKKTTKEYY